MFPFDGVGRRERSNVRARFDLLPTELRTLGISKTLENLPVINEKQQDGIVFYPVAKRLFDVTFVLLCAPFLLPLFAMVAALIKLDSPGPVFFRHERLGKNGKPFKMLKFRTMVIDAEERKKSLMELNEYSGGDFKIAKDPRVTRIGRHLRALSLDELPQLIHVITGKMSLVGPRATSIPLEYYQPEELERLTVLPGIAGPAQLLARGQEFSSRCKYDIWYVRNRSFMMDLRLLLLVVLVFLTVPNGQ
ncbi:sugar transferase [Silicimonas sp. MF1-12-2]|uniref:sugar transferase n=1 Tax=Silicimonas sp. MF1-12-2 TaxID=3384793 RepID=UPI0039B381C3